MEHKTYFNKPPVTETIAKKMQIAVGMAGIFPPIKTDFSPKVRKQRVTEQEIRGE